MKKFLLPIMALLLFVVACEKNDDYVSEQVDSELDGQESTINRVEKNGIDESSESFILKSASSADWDLKYSSSRRDVDEDQVWRYSFTVKKGVQYKIELRTYDGDADLYVGTYSDWDYYGKSRRGGTSTDEVIFTSNIDGRIYYRVEGYYDSEYRVYRYEDVSDPVTIYGPDMRYYNHIQQPEDLGYYSCGQTTYSNARTVRSNYSTSVSSVEDIHDRLMEYTTYQNNGNSATVYMLSELAEEDGFSMQWYNDDPYFSKEERYLDYSGTNRTRFKSFIEDALQSDRLVIMPCRYGFVENETTAGHFYLIVEIKHSDNGIELGYKEVWRNFSSSTRYISYTKALNSNWYNNRGYNNSSSGQYKTSWYTAFAFK